MQIWGLVSVIIDTIQVKMSADTSHHMIESEVVIEAEIAEQPSRRRPNPITASSPESDGVKPVSRILAVNTDLRRDVDQFLRLISSTRTKPEVDTLLRPGGPP